MSGTAPDSEALDRMIGAIVHRGPDDSGTFFEQGVALGFRRLSILDLAPSGHQPMLSADGRHVIVFNGEIFNYVELRSELEARGHVFRSTGDTEVLLNAYREWGADCLQRFNGMWAFLILDRTTRRIFGARDRFGVKPLFVYGDNRWTLFASEIKAIRDSGLARLSVDWRTVSRFVLESRLDDTEESFFSGVRKIPPGCAFEVDPQGAVRTWRYWSLENGVSPPEKDPVAQFAGLFEDAVRLRMRSDVPVGVLLSGGMDSTSIICNMSRGRNLSATGPLRAFCYMEPAFDETSFIDATLRQTGAQLHRLDLTAAQLWEDLPDHLHHHDEPAHSPTSLIGFKLMELASRNGVKVLLNGQGADEVLGGYSNYFLDYWVSLLGAGRPLSTMRSMRRYGAVHGGRLAARALQALQMLVRNELRRLGPYRNLSERRRLRRLRADPWYRGPVQDVVRQENQRFACISLSESLRRSVEVAPLPLYLRVEDRNSMAHSVEARVPFLDYRLVSLAFKLNDEFKLDAPWNKRLLREAMRGSIPEIVRTRAQKFGFPSPVDAWFRNEWYEPCRALIAELTPVLREVCDVQAALRDLEAHRTGRVDIGPRLFDLAQLGLWLDQCRRSQVSFG